MHRRMLRRPPELTIVTGDAEIGASYENRRASITIMMGSGACAIAELAADEADTLAAFLASAARGLR